MATVMSWGNSEGVKGRCDSTRHYVTLPHCSCTCRGLYHGTKLNGTFDQVQRDHGREIIKEAKRRAEEEGWSIRFAEDFAPLFAGEV